MITISFDDMPGVRNRLAGIDSPEVLRRVLKNAAIEIMQINIERVKDQLNDDRSKYAPHHRRRRRKMLTRLIKKIKILRLTEKECVIGWPSPVEGQIAAKHQFGATEVVTKNQNRSWEIKKANSDNWRRSENATREQARSLINAGYKRRVTGRGYQTPSIKWITENMTLAQAGWILRQLRETKIQWTTRLPPRTVLAADHLTQNEFNRLDNAISNAFLSQLTALL